ncbi:hypothetical protein, partial [Nocardia carnea]|uniref:hypothetical protein n=1 Tax=Nocardia carnea TaxID=37328 RepID=UPI00245580B3
MIRPRGKLSLPAARIGRGSDRESRERGVRPIQLIAWAIGWLLAATTYPARKTGVLGAAVHV